MPNGNTLSCMHIHICAPIKRKSKTNHAGPTSQISTHCSVYLTKIFMHKIFGNVFISENKMILDTLFLSGFSFVTLSGML